VYSTNGSVFELNVDGSSFGNSSHGSFGGLIRNNIGEWMHGFSGSCGRASNILAELYAILKGLQLAWDLGYCTITLESDSKSAIDLILKDDNNFLSHNCSWSDSYLPATKLVFIVLSYS
jgi:ribonuclease HI